MAVNKTSLDDIVLLNKGKVGYFNSTNCTLSFADNNSIFFEVENVIVDNEVKTEVFTISGCNYYGLINKIELKTSQVEYNSYLSLCTYKSIETELFINDQCYYHWQIIPVVFDKNNYHVHFTQKY